MLFHFAVAGCIDPVDFNVKTTDLQLVVNGFITDQPGPYTVTLYKARRLKADLDFSVPVTGASITIFSDAGEEETLTETIEGTYVTSQIVGEIGKSYFIKITTSDGAAYESIPEKIRPAGEIESLTYEYEMSRDPQDLDNTADNFRVIVGSRTSPGEESFIRWRVVGTYQIETRPWLRTPVPYPCSGETGTNGIACTCCTCWISRYDEIPTIADEQHINGNEFRHITIGRVPIRSEFFVDKYHVAVSQMSLTQSTYNYFRLIKAQKEGVSSLFQPVSGKLRGNINRLNGEEEVQGIFWAAGVTTSTLTITKDNLPYTLMPAPQPIIECDVLKNSTATKPDFW